MHYRIMDFCATGSSVLCLLCFVTQSDLCNPRNCSLPGSFVQGDTPGKNTGVGCHALPQGILPTQGLNPGLPHCRWILYHLSHQGRLGFNPWVRKIPERRAWQPTPVFSPRESARTEEPSGLQSMGSPRVRHD